MSSIVTSSEVSVRVGPSAATATPAVKRSASHWSCAISSSEQAIIDEPGAEVHIRVSSASSYGANMVLQPAFTDRLPSSKVSWICESATSSWPVTSVDT